MRIIGRISGARKAYLFTTFLGRKEIEATAEKHPTSLDSEEVFDIWVTDEDQVDAAKGYLSQFHEHPDDPQFLCRDEPKKEEKEVSLSPFQSVPDEHPPKIIPVRRSSGGPLTRLIVMLCIGLFALTYFQLRQINHQEKGVEAIVFIPALRLLMYDIPLKWTQEKVFFEKYGIESSSEVEKLPSEAQAVYKKIKEEPMWNGLYTLILQWPNSKEELSASLFEQIRHGQLWRIFTPIFLHGGFLHLAFNMLWLWVLGKQLEERLKLWQYIVITLIIAAISNTVQYLMGGPAFLGYSGVLCGMVGFIWVRQRIAPWEGYPLQPITIAILAIFVLGLLALQIISFFFTFFGGAAFSLGMIANSAHISGAICGIILGRISLFSKGDVT